MEEDLQLISNVKNTNDGESLKELIDRHSGIYVDMVNKYIPKSIEGICKEDILDDKNFCIYDAVIKFDESKNTKFSTYVGNLARWRCLNIYNKKVKFPQNNIDDISLVKDHRSYNLSKNSEISMLEEEENLDRIFKLIKNSEDPRVEKIFKMRYKNGEKLTPWKKIAKKLDLSIQGCINIHNKHLTEIKKYV